MGIILVLIIGRLTEYFTSTEKPPVTEIANATRTGTATMILTGLAEGLESSVWAAVAIAVTIFGAFAIFSETVLAVLRHRPGGPGTADHYRLSAGDGYLRAHHRQRQRHLRDVRRAEG